MGAPPGRSQGLCAVALWWAPSDHLDSRQNHFSIAKLEYICIVVIKRFLAPIGREKNAAILQNRDFKKMASVSGTIVDPSNPLIAGLVNGTYWTVSEITYYYPQTVGQYVDTAASNYNGGRIYNGGNILPAIATFKPFNPEMQKAVDLVLNCFSAVANLHFVKKTDDSLSDQALLRYTVSATDADTGTTLTYSFAGGADDAKFSINGATGVVTFRASPDFESKADAGTNNVYDIIVQASDGTKTATQAVAITLTKPSSSRSPM